METIIDGSERQTIVKLLVEEEEERQDDDGITANSHGTNVGQESHRDYQQYAEECLRWADEADNEQHRELFLGMARAWTQAD